MPSPIVDNKLKKSLFGKSSPSIVKVIKENHVLKTSQSFPNNPALLGHCSKYQRNIYASAKQGYKNNKAS